MKKNPIEDLQARLDLRNGNTRTIWDDVEDFAKAFFYVVSLLLGLAILLRIYG